MKPVAARASVTVIIVAIFSVLTMSAMISMTAMTGTARAEGLAKAPAVVLADLKGGKVKLDYRTSQLTLVNFWAVWCGPCRQEMPHIASMVQKYGGEKFKAFGIAIQSGEPADVKDYLERHKDAGINYTILMGTDDTLTQFGDVYSVPTTFLVGPDGTVLRRFVGVTPGFSVKLEDEIKKGLAPAKP